MPQALAAMRDCARICRYLHVPAQSGSDRILKAMNRGYTAGSSYDRYSCLVFPADNGCFSVTMCVPEIEYELRKAIVRPETWDRMVDSLPITFTPVAAS